MTDGPLIVQSDKTVLLEVDHEQAGAARAAIAPFAELERAPEHVHTYRITPLALWNARAAGHDAEQVVDALVSFSRRFSWRRLIVSVRVGAGDRPVMVHGWTTTGHRTRARFRQAADFIRLEISPCLACVLRISPAVRRGRSGRGFPPNCDVIHVESSSCRPRSA